MSRKAPFTNHEHLGAGALLGRMEGDLTAFANAVGSAYGVPLMEKVLSVRKALMKLRSALDSEVCSENPMSVSDIEGVAITRAYYGWSRPDVPRIDSGYLEAAFDALVHHYDTRLDLADLNRVKDLA